MQITTVEVLQIYILIKMFRSTATLLQNFFDDH